MKVAVIGMGKTGLPMAVALYKSGCEVVGVEISESRLTELADPDWEPAEPGCSWEERQSIELVQEISSAVQKTDLALMIVQTPETAPFSGVIDLRPIKAASEQIGQALAAHSKPYTVIMSSTVPPGTCRDVMAPRVGPTCSVTFSPVWIALGSVIDDYLNPPVSVLGADGGVPAAAAEFFKTVFAAEEPLITDTVTAEATKLVYNVWCTLKMAFVNEAAGVFEAAGGDPSIVEKFFKSGGERPGAFLKPGPPPGGPCFPRDLRFAHQLKTGTSCFDVLVKAIDQSNDLGLTNIVGSIETGVDRKRVGIVGLTYKPNVPVVEETVSYLLAEQLVQLGHDVVAYDFLVNFGVPAGVELASSLEECIRHSDVLIEMHAGSVPEDVGIPVVRPWRQ